MLLFSLYAASHQAGAGDTWIALASGRHLAQHGFAAGDPFGLGAGPASAVPWSNWWHPSGWINQNWLSHVLFYRLSVIGGLETLVGLKIALCLGIVLAVYSCARNLGSSHLPSAVGACAAAWVMRPFLDIRPALFTGICSPPLDQSNCETSPIARPRAHDRPGEHAEASYFPVATGSMLPSARLGAYGRALPRRNRRRVARGGGPMQPCRLANLTHPWMVSFGPDAGSGLHPGWQPFKQTGRPKGGPLDPLRVIARGGLMFGGRPCAEVGPRRDFHSGQGDGIPGPTIRPHRGTRDALCVLAIDRAMAPPRHGQLSPWSPAQEWWRWRRSDASRPGSRSAWPMDVIAPPVRPDDRHLDTLAGDAISADNGVEGALFSAWQEGGYRVGAGAGSGLGAIPIRVLMTARRRRPGPPTTSASASRSFGGRRRDGRRTERSPRAGAWSSAELRSRGVWLVLVPGFWRNTAVGQGLEATGEWRVVFWDGWHTLLVDSGTKSGSDLHQGLLNGTIRYPDRFSWCLTLGRNVLIGRSSEGLRREAIDRLSEALLIEPSPYALELAVSAAGSWKDLEAPVRALCLRVVEEGRGFLDAPRSRSGAALRIDMLHVAAKYLGPEYSGRGSRFRAPRCARAVGRGGSSKLPVS
jgi:hypothetical protein